MKKESRRRVGLLGLGLGLLMVIAVRGADDLGTKCSTVVEKVIPCLDFATGKEATPKKECCDATKEMKESKPECLCYIIQETHKGSQKVKSLGIQEPKLLQLPSACNLQNATVANCPKLLGLSPNSPDAAIFTNSSKVTPAAPATTDSQSTTPQSQNASYGSLVRPSTSTDVMLMGLAIIVLAFPTEFVSMIWSLF